MQASFLKVLTGMASAMLLSACAGLGTDATPEEVVWERAQAWATAAMKGDYKTAFTYTSPNYRKFSSPGAYHADIGGASIWEKAEVSRVECQEEVCDVRILVEYPLRQVNVYAKTRRDQKWVKNDGQWWLYVAP